ncbi:MAG: cutinase family protein [Leifsonia sp.]
MATLLAAMFAVTASIPAMAVSASSRCGFTTLIAVRGSDEAGGSGTANGGRTYGSGGWGATLGELIGYANREPNVPIYTEAVSYPAVILNWSDPFNQNYINSVNAGMTNLRNEIENMAVGCPSTNIVLAGYSQGAHVITRVLSAATATAFPTSALSASARAHIKAVVLFGNPTFTPGEPYDWSGSGGGRGIFADPAGSLTPYRTLAWLPPAYSAKGYLPIVRSYCLAGDMFCQSNANGLTIHASYKSNATVMRDAWLFIHNWLVSND